MPLYAQIVSCLASFSIETKPRVLVVTKLYLHRYKKIKNFFLVKSTTYDFYQKKSVKIQKNFNSIYYRPFLVKEEVV